ncbi:MAG: DUF72 domain-containing protein [Bacillota bacterium]
MRIRIGTAGWSIPRQVAPEFPAEGSSLERYAARFGVAEINSSFHRPHRQSTWQRWHDSVPESFRFSVKLPKAITHQAKLVGCSDALAHFLDQTSPLGEKLAVYLVQLPPKLAFDETVAAAFFGELAQGTPANIACEPRHPSWFTAEADDFLERTDVARVAADPAVCEAAALPGGSSKLRYWRLHGSPAMYRSSYQDRIGLYAATLRQSAPPAQESWCIFDNTASSAAAGDALALMRAIEAG